MSAMSGDFIGFTFNGIKSSDLGIIRTSGGDRFEDKLFGEIENKQIENTNGDGNYYQGSIFKPRERTIQIAYDDLSEEQMREMAALFGDRQIHKLIFDELPFKTYFAKVSEPPSLSYICFNDDETGKRIYKGEGEINFIYYKPFGICEHKFLDYYTTEGIDSSEWASAAKLVSTKGDLDTFTNKLIKVYNPGDFNAPFMLDIKATNVNSAINSVFTLALEGQTNTNSINGFSFNYTLLSGDEGIRIDTDRKLILGIKTENGATVETSNIYNIGIVAGDFFSIPNGAQRYEFSFTNTNVSAIDINYNYIYI